MRLRLILSYALIVLVSVGSVVIIARRSAATEVGRFMFRGGMTGTEELVTSLEEYYQTYHSWQGAESLFSMPGRGKGAGRGQGAGAGMMGGMMNQRILLADDGGNLVFDTDNPLASGHLTQAELDNAISLTVDGQTAGYLLTEGGFAFDPGTGQRLIDRIDNAALSAGLIAGALSLLLALVLAYRLMRPVRELTQAAGKLAKGDLAQRVPVRGNDELGILGRTFNQMAATLQQSEESRRAMTADIAHELRNPLAVQRANLEALQDGIYPLTPDNLNSILDQNLLLTRLVDDLRTLALAESGQLRLERTQADLPALVKRVGDRFEAQAASQQVTLRVSAPAQDVPLLPMSLDPGRVEQIIGNLISNALRHTPQGGFIDLQVSSCNQGAELTVRDTGTGIPAEALPHIFERFYRADRSRSRSEGGTGLGLAIARQLAEAHGGTLTAANHAEGGAIFTLTLPV